MTEAATKFPSPFEIPAPAGAEGWQEMYPYYLVFNEKLKEKQEGAVLVLQLAALAVTRSSRSTRSAVDFAVKGVEPVQYPPSAGAAGQRPRRQDPQRLPLHEPGAGRARGYSRPRARCFSSAPATITRTGTALLDNWKTKITEASIDEMAAHQVRGAARHAADRGHLRRQGQGPLDRPAQQLRPRDPARA